MISLLPYQIGKLSWGSAEWPGMGSRLDGPMSCLEDFDPIAGMRARPRLQQSRFRARLCSLQEGIVIVRWLCQFEAALGLHPGATPETSGAQ